MRASTNTREALQELYQLLLKAYGPQHWWPGDTPFEVIVGAILTQSTSWANVASAIRNLKAAGELSPEAMRRFSVSNDMNILVGRDPSAAATNDSTAPDVHANRDVPSARAPAPEHAAAPPKPSTPKPNAPKLESKPEPFF